MNNQHKSLRGVIIEIQDYIINSKLTPQEIAVKLDVPVQWIYEVQKTIEDEFDCIALNVELL